MNILLVNHYAGSLKHGMEYRPFYFAREWIKAGYNVTIVGASFSHLRTSNPQLNLPYYEEYIDGIRYIWLKTPSYSGNGIGRIMNMLSFVASLYRYKGRITRDNNFDVVIASSTYPLDIYPANMIAKKTKARLIFEVHDLWPLSPMELGNIPAWHPYIVLMQIAENYAYKVSDKVVSILPKAYDHMVEHGMAKDKYAHIPNGIVVDDWEEQANLPKEHERVINDLKSENQFIIGYAGAHGIANSLDTLLEAAKFLIDKPVKLVLVGEGLEKEKLVQQANSSKLNNVIFLPYIDKKAVPTLLDCMDVLFIGANKQPLYRFGVSPNKLMDYMMAGKPIINAIEAGNDPVAESGCGISVPAEDPKAIADAIMTLWKMEDYEREEMGKRGQEYVLQHHDYRVLAEKFLGVMEGD